jgi:glycosyltransferase involved in cell wall biosynthesis
MIDKYYFNESVAHFFQANDAASLANAILLLAGDGDLRKTLVANADEFMKAFTWKANQDRYLDIVDSLLHTEKGLEVRNGKSLA